MEESSPAEEESSPGKEESSPAKEVDEVQFAFLYFEYANDFQMQNFVFLVISFAALIFAICFLISVQFITVSGAARIAFGILPVLPSLFGQFLCVAWSYHKRRHNSILRSIYSNLIDLHKHIDGENPFLFNVQRGFNETGPITLWQLWNYIIVLMFYLHTLVVLFGIWLSFLRIDH